MADLHVRIPNETQDRLNAALPWGTKQRVFEVLIEGLLVVLESPHKDAYLGMLINGDMSILDMVRAAQDRDTPE